MVVIVCGFHWSKNYSSWFSKQTKNTILLAYNTAEVVVGNNIIIPSRWLFSFSFGLVKNKTRGILYNYFAISGRVPTHLRTHKYTNIRQKKSLRALHDRTYYITDNRCLPFARNTVS